MNHKQRYLNSNGAAIKAVIFLGVLAFVLAGCDQLKKKGGAADKAATESKEGKESAEKKKPAGPCEEYAQKICEVASDTSPTCQSMKSLTEVIPEAACKAGMTNIEYTKTKLKEMRKSCDELSNKLCTDIGPATETCTMVKTQVAKLPPERCQDMLKQYPRVVADLKKREESNKPLTPDKQKIIVDGATNVFGPENAKVTIVEFSDFQCPYCSRAAAATKKVKEKYGDKIRFVFRNFPLSFHNRAHQAAEAGMAASAQGKFWQFHDIVFENQRALERADLEKYAEQAKLDVKAFKKALDDKTYEKAVDADVKLGEEVFVNGTPTMFLNGKRIQNPTDFDMISKEIDAALK
jgi:protein-disulfide isomerase